MEAFSFRKEPVSKSEGHRERLPEDFFLSTSYATRCTDDDVKGVAPLVEGAHQYRC